MRIDLFGLGAIVVIAFVAFAFGVILAPADEVIRYQLICPVFGESRLVYEGDPNQLDPNTRQFVEECDVVQVKE